MQVLSACGQVAPECPHLPEAGGAGSGAWWDWAEGSLDARLVQELGKKGASSFDPLHK